MNDADPEAPGIDWAEPPRPRTLADGLLDGAVAAVRERHQPDGLIQRMFRQIRRWLAFGSLVYLVALVVALVLGEWFGEMWWPLWAALFAPPLAWLLPLVVLTPLCVLFRPRLCLLHLLCAAIVLGPFMKPRWSLHPSAKGPTLTVLSNNIGQKNNQSLRPFIDSEQPDVILLQDAKFRGPRYAKFYADRHVGYHREYVCISRYPIIDSGLLTDLHWLGHPVAAWFELDFAGTPIVVYNVHLPSPRRDLARLYGLRGLVKEFLRSIGRWPDDGEEPLDVALGSRVDIAFAFFDLVASDPRPVVLAGDFNVPAHGQIYHRFARQYDDAFARRGRGYGFTFPGRSRNPTSFFGPWLRLDYVFSDAAWRPVYCRTEPWRSSQHRALAATLEWRGPAPVAPPKESR